jgi:hypothetical protein
MTNSYLNCFETYSPEMASIAEETSEIQKEKSGRKKFTLHQILKNCFQTSNVRQISSCEFQPFMHIGT